MFIVDALGVSCILIHRNALKLHLDAHICRLSLLLYLYSHGVGFSISFIAFFTLFTTLNNNIYCRGLYIFLFTSWYVLLYVLKVHLTV